MKESFFKRYVLGFFKHVFWIWVLLFFILFAIFFVIEGFSLEIDFLVSLWVMLCVITFFLPIKIKVEQNTYVGLETFPSGSLVVKWPGWNFKSLFQRVPKDKKTFLQDTKKESSVSTGIQTWPTRTGPVQGEAKIYYSCNIKNDYDGTPEEKARRRFTTTTEIIEERLKSKLESIISMEFQFITADEAKQQRKQILAQNSNEFDSICYDTGMRITQIDFVDLDDPKEIAEAKQGKVVADLWAENLNFAFQKIMKSPTNPNGIFEESERAEAIEFIKSQFLKHYSKVDTGGRNPVIIHP